MNAKRRPTTPKLRTAAKARQWLIDQGLSVTAFAEMHGLSRDAVNYAFRSSSKCRVGKTHDAAVALGMKKAAPNSHTDSQESTRIRTVPAKAGKAAVRKGTAKKVLKAREKA